MLISEGNSQKYELLHGRANWLIDYVEKAELFNDIFTSVGAYFLNSAYICLILEAGLQETKKLEAT